MRAGCDYADVGCGSGRALVKLAPEFPRSRFVGYERLPGPGRARPYPHLQAGGTAAISVSVQVADAATGLPERLRRRLDVRRHPRRGGPARPAAGIHKSLTADGAYICLDTNCADRHEDNAGPVAAMLYGISVFYCMTTSLANGGAGLGTCGLPEARARELCVRAGFSTLRRVPMDNPFNSLYEVSA